MEQSGDSKKELFMGTYRYETALSQAILNHYCKTMESITGKTSEEIKAEIILEKERLIVEHRETLNSRN